MPKVKFIFDKKKDLWNIHRVCNNNYFGSDSSKGMPQKVIDIAKGKTFEECKEKLEENYKFMHQSPLIPVILKSASESWEKIECEYFEILEKITKKPICAEKFTAELTMVGRCPYDTDKNSFMFGFFYSIPGIMQVVGHELMHLQFHKYFWGDIEREIGFEKTDDLKEALTVLLNLKFKHLWFVEDKGYESHKELRKFILEKWDETKDFDQLLNECVKYLKTK